MTSQRLASARRARVVDRLATFSAELDTARATGRTVGLVPTMGALHEGHASLVRRAASECDVVAVTVFVNPLQFGAGEDLDAYPRDLDGDVAMAGRAGASLVFAPPVEEIYRPDDATTVSVRGLTEVLEGAARPGHFTGVTTVVARLLAAAGRCKAYFGEKDFQQLAVVRRMATDLAMPAEIVGCPTVRSADGLALSSRNSYLDADERAAATVLFRALTAAASLIAGGERDALVVQAHLEGAVLAEPRAELDYAVVVSSDGLRPMRRLGGDVRLLVAARFGQTRLIDNLGVSV